MRFWPLAVTTYELQIVISKSLSIGRIKVSLEDTSHAFGQGVQVLLMLYGLGPLALVVVSILSSGTSSIVLRNSVAHGLHMERPSSKMDLSSLVSVASCSDTMELASVVALTSLLVESVHKMLSTCYVCLSQRSGRMSRIV